MLIELRWRATKAKFSRNSFVIFDIINEDFAFWLRACGSRKYLALSVFEKLIKMKLCSVFLKSYIRCLKNIKCVYSGVHEA